MEQGDLQYSDGARDRVRKVGAAKLGEFIADIPSRRVDSWLLSLPQVPGFRSKGKQAADEQRRRLIQRLTSSGKQSERDWHLFRHLWMAWLDEQVRDEGLRQVLGVDEHGPEAHGGVPLSERVHQELARVAEAGNISRETLEALVSYGPFNETSMLYSAARGAPHDRDIERDKYLSTLPERLAEIDRRVKEALETADARNRSGSSDGAESTANQLNEVTKLLSSLSTQVGSLVQWQDAAAKILEEDSRRGAELESRLKVFEESLSPQESSKDSLSSATKVDELVDELLEVIGRLENLETQIRSLDESTAVRQNGERSALPNIGTNGLVLRRFEPSTDSEAIEIAKPKDLLQHLSRQFNASGLLDRDATVLAREVTGALLTSQIVSFSGSSSIEILRALIDGLGGVWEIGSVPVGVFDDTCLRRWKDGGSVAGRFALQNINSSAFEIYGTPIREAVVRAQLRRDAIDLVFCGSLIEGHGGLPIIMSYSELGPIINTDSFVWRSNANSEGRRTSSPGVRIAKGTVLPEADETVNEHVTESLNSVGVTPSVVFRATVRNASSVLMQLSNNETDVLESLLASWLFPYLIASGVTAQTVVEKLSPTPVGKYATGARLGKLVSSYAKPQR